jgi:hypothetical protein
MIPTLTPGRRLMAGVLAALAPGALIGAADAQAASPTSAVCTSRFVTTITPGFTTRPSSGTFTTHGQTGSITCVGRIHGHRVTGPGSIGAEESYTAGTCNSHIGSGSIRADIPTTAGIEHMVGELIVRRTGLVVRPEVRFPGARFTSIGAAIPLQGDCVLKPQRRALVVVTGSISGA